MSGFHSKQLFLRNSQEIIIIKIIIKIIIIIIIIIMMIVITIMII